ncbi:hypothetical protein CROQUDRAFT_54401 [Cronartium quercuum f. sp. fusiforme G11]|uniref:Ribosomal silencing factor RsfS n=1 Tax=Cronartium quercuum f. sp. fusiforme G11 TaxID=708437 RepID=A0A9P6N978_9BASI|nr:hypothetical protein CROQUDRAFT_54401 [Cronartium quercuum f. sp. fusiforme G11]
MLLETDEREEVALRQILRERFQSTVPNWQEPLSVWRNEETGEIEWLEAQSIPAETLESTESNPWFVDEPEPEPDQTTDVSSSSPIPPPPLPLGLPDKLLPLYRYLIDSPFLDRDTISFIDAKAELYGHGDAAWTDWVIVVQLKEGREGGIRGATEAVREILSATTSAQVRVEGITGNPSSTWTMVDAGKAVVHILTKESRQIYKIEDIWTGQRQPLAA